MRVLIAGVAAGLLLTHTPVWADPWEKPSGYGWHRAMEFKEKFRDGPCKVERELKRDGSYKEERECKGADKRSFRHQRVEYQEKYWDGLCKIEREWKRDGTYKEKIDCRGPTQRSRHG